MRIIELLLQNWDSVAVFFMVVAIVIVLIAKKQYAILDKIIFALVTEAERQYGGDTGLLKLAVVVDRVYPKIPAVLRLLITERQLEKVIERVLADAKERWKENPNITAYLGNIDGK